MRGIVIFTFSRDHFCLPSHACSVQKYSTVHVVARWWCCLQYRHNKLACGELRKTCMKVGHQRSSSKRTGPGGRPIIGSKSARPNSGFVDSIGTHSALGTTCRSCALPSSSCSGTANCPSHISGIGRSRIPTGFASGICSYKAKLVSIVCPGNKLQVRYPSYTVYDLSYQQRRKNSLDFCNLVRKYPRCT